MIKTKAIVLNRCPRGECDSLVYLYTLDHGKIVLGARGTNKQGSKLAAHLEPFNFVELMLIKGRDYLSIGSAISQNSFSGIKSSFSSLFLVGRIISFLDKHIREGQSDFDLFIFLNDFLNFIDQETLRIEERDRSELEFLVDLFRFKFLDHLGYSFQDDICVNCGSKHDLVGAGWRENGILCSSCWSTFRRQHGHEHYFALNQNILDIKSRIKNSNFSHLLEVEKNNNLQKFIKEKIIFLGLS